MLAMLLRQIQPQPSFSQRQRCPLLRYELVAGTPEFAPLAQLEVLSANIDRGITEVVVLSPRKIRYFMHFLRKFFLRLHTRFGILRRGSALDNVIAVLPRFT